MSDYAEYFATFVLPSQQPNTNHGLYGCVSRTAHKERPDACCNWGPNTGFVELCPICNTRTAWYCPLCNLFYVKYVLIPLELPQHTVPSPRIPSPHNRFRVISSPSYPLLMKSLVPIDQGTTQTYMASREYLVVVLLLVQLLLFLQMLTPTSLLQRLQSSLMPLLFIKFRYSLLLLLFFLLLC